MFPGLGHTDDVLDEALVLVADAARATAARLAAGTGSGS
jgi:hypothetical protein